MSVYDPTLCSYSDLYEHGSPYKQVMMLLHWPVLKTGLELPIVMYMSIMPCTHALSSQPALYKPNGNKGKLSTTNIGSIGRIGIIAALETRHLVCKSVGFHGHLFSKYVMKFLSIYLFYICGFTLIEA